MSLSQRNRKSLTKKATQKVVNKINGVKTNGHHPENPLEVPHLRKIEADLEQLGRALNHNAELFSHTMMVQEMRTNILQRVLNDTLMNQLHTVPIERTKWAEEWVKGPDGSARMEEVPSKEIARMIDFPWYQEYYMVCMVMTEFASWLKSLHAAREKNESKESAILVAPSNDELEVYGGTP